MTFTVEAKGRAVREAPAIVHVDGSSRVQTVDEAHTPLFARLIKQFAEITGVPMVLNTSFNDHGAPMVETALPP